MYRTEVADLMVFVAVAEQRSFTRAASRLGMSQSALSQIVRRLETRLGLRLLSRTTRSVAPTEVGERLLRSLTPLLQDIDASVAALGEFRERPVGTFRITTVEHAAKMFLLPALAKLLPLHPDIVVDVTVDYGLADVVADRFDAGVRLGESVAKDMIAVRISPDISMAVVATAEYLKRFSVPESPKELVHHRCLNLRVPTSGTLYEWRFVKRGRTMRVRVIGPLIFNTIELILAAALDGHGLAYLPLDQVEEHVEAGRLVRVLESWMQPLPAYHLYYPNRRHSSAAFSLLVEAVRYRPPRE